MAVMIARKRIRFFAAANVASTLPPKRSLSRFSCPNAWTMRMAPSVSETIAPTSAIRSWLVREADCSLRPIITIGMTNDRNCDQQFDGQLWCQCEKVDRAADAHNDVAKRDRNGGANNLLDNRRIACHSTCNFGRPIFFEKGRALPQKVPVHCKSDIGDRAFAEPGYEVKTEGGCDCHHRYDQQQILEPGALCRQGHRLPQSRGR